MNKLLIVLSISLLASCSSHKFQLDGIDYDEQQTQKLVRELENENITLKEKLAISTDKPSKMCLCLIN